ncbi:MAG: alpha/beta fold hydrolase [Hahellaceae bacterium]|nr:alpha/beta fold hydrolase [Hahellaceae bacterium]MCP5168402.1 alpha/beta fold hydrolase [Hahellaceae bacterium]
MVLKLHHKIQGKGEPIILVHGLFGSLENLGMIARLLAQHYEVHSLDMRNHGRSPHVPMMNYQLMANDIAHYMDEKGLAKAVLLGHSMGGKTVMQFALMYPERVERLVVADIAPVEYPPHHSEIFEGLRNLDLDVLTSRQQADEVLSRFVPEIAIRSFLLKNLVKAGADRFVWRMNLPVIMQCYNEIMRGQQGDKPFTGKVLFVIGGHSGYVQKSHQPQVLALFPAASVRVIPETGHWLHAEKPELFAKVVERFLAA